METENPKAAETARKREERRAQFAAKNARRRAARDQLAASRTELRQARQIRQGLGGAFGNEKSEVANRAKVGTSMK